MFKNFHRMVCLFVVTYTKERMYKNLCKLWSELSTKVSNPHEIIMKFTKM